MSKNKNIVLLSNIASLGTVQIVNYIFPLLTIPFISRIIGPSGFGVMNYITAFVGYFVLIVGFGFDLTATREIARVNEDKEKISNIFSKVFGSRVLLTTLSLFCFLICMQFFPILSNNKTLAFIIFFNVITTIITPQYIYQGLQKLSILSILTLLRGIINTILIFVLINEKNSLITYASILVFSNLVNNSIALFIVVFSFRLKLKILKISDYFEFIKYSRLIFYSSVVYSLYTSANVIILGFFAEDSEIGFYTTAVSFINIAQSVVNIPLSTSLFPFIGKSFSESKELGIERIRMILPTIIYFMLAVSFALVISAPWLVVLIYGDKFSNSVVPVQILALLPTLSAFSSTLGVQIMMNLSMDKLFFRVTSVVAVISILLNIVLAKQISYYGSAISYLVVEVIIAISLYIILKNKNINVLDRKYFSPLFIVTFFKSFF